MRKIVVLIAVACAAVFALVGQSLTGQALTGQSLTTNEYYLRSLELERLASQAFEYGDYDAAADYAAQAQEYAEMSDLYVATRLLKEAATDRLAQAQTRYVWAASEEVAAALRYPDQFTAATLALEEAKLEFSYESFQKTIDQASRVLELLAALTPVPVFPAYYVVQRQSSLTDCLWRIAALPSVYNDPLRWPELYRANRAIMPQPGNPDLILPGMILRIPALRGEKREGTWRDGETYPVFGQTETPAPNTQQ